MAHDSPNPRIDLVSRAGIGTGLPEGFVPRCPGCRYVLLGLTGSRCPECGARFSIPQLIADWRFKQAQRFTGGDVLGAALLAFFAAIPTNLLHPDSALWKGPVLIGLWALSWVCFRRRAEELREPTEGHRLLWVWLLCGATAVGMLPTPVLNLVVCGLTLSLAGLATVVAFRRSPEKTAVVMTIGAATPAAGLALLAAMLVLEGLAGSGQGHYWSSADYPSWYWHGRGGRTRGVNNHDAVRIGIVAFGISIGLVATIVGMWATLMRRRLRRGKVAMEPAPVGSRRVRLRG